MADFIRTYTGEHFFPTDPDPSLFRVEDFAHALSLLCRGNGHVKTFWSVAEHCICCAKEAAERGYSARLVLACLLHDASECYLSDVPRPFKREMKAYQALEDRMLDMIYARFLGSPLSEEEKRQVRGIDDAMLWFDLKYLLGGEETGEQPEVHIPIDYKVRPFEEVEREYLELYVHYANIGFS